MSKLLGQIIRILIFDKNYILMFRRQHWLNWIWCILHIHDLWTNIFSPDIFCMLHHTSHKALASNIFRYFLLYTVSFSTVHGYFMLSFFARSFKKVVFLVSHRFQSSLSNFGSNGLSCLPVIFSLTLLQFNLFNFLLGSTFYFQKCLPFQFYTPCSPQVYHWWWPWEASRGVWRQTSYFYRAFH